MKIATYILSSLAAAICAVSCIGQIEEEDLVTAAPSKATFTFTPSMLAEAIDVDATKSLASLPNIHNLYFAVFDNAGYKLNEYAQAVPNTYADQNWDPKDPEENVFSYSVTLTVTDQPRIIHILANAPEHLIYGSEAEVIGSLNTHYDATETDGDWSDAYWVRIYLDQGVWAKPDESTKDTDPKYNEKYDKWMHVVNTLNEAKFVRNFARIILEETADNFELTRFWITNIPDIGSFAPYNRNTGRFQIDYNTYKKIDDLASPTGGNYPGFYPASASLIKLGDYLEDDTMLNRLKADAGSNWTTFTYEREVPKEDPICLIVGGKYNGGAESFYKIDLRDHQGKYFPLLRDFTYKVRITNVGTKGASSIAKALSNAPSGDVDSSLEMQGITNISNGTSQLFVSETSEIVVGEGHDIVLRYKYIPDRTVDSNKDGFADAVNTVLTKGSTEETAARTNKESYVTIERSNGLTGAVFSSINAKPGYDGDNYSDIVLHSKDANEIIRTETITITGHHWNETARKYETISRSSNYKLRETLHMQVEFSPAKIPSGINQPIDLIISLEAGLPSSMFSLNFNIEMLGLSLTTNNDPLPITTGQSQISGNTKPAYHFQRTITWSEYQAARIVDGYKQFVCHFKTNTKSLNGLDGVQTIYANAGGEGVLPSKPGDIVNVKNKYFHDQTTFYSTYGAKTFSNVAISRAAEVGEDGTLTFQMESPFPNGESSSVVTVGLNGFEPADLGSYPMVGTRDGYELYEVTVYDTERNGVPAYQGRLDIVPFESGTCSVRLYADEYKTADKDHKTVEGVYIHVNEDGSAQGDRMVQAIGYQIAPAGSVVAGQKAKLTVYIADAPAGAEVKIGNIATTKSNYTYVTIDGKDYYRYTTNSNYSTSSTGTNDSNNSFGAKREAVRVTINGKIAKTIHIPVYGIELGTGSTATTHEDYNTSKRWYVFNNRSFNNYYLSNNGSNLLLGSSSLDYYSLIGFATNKTTTNVVVLTDDGLKYVTGYTNNANLGLNQNSRNATAYTLSDGLYIAPSNQTKRYWRQENATSNVQTSTTNSNNTFTIYPVTFTPPPTP